MLYTASYQSPVGRLTLAAQAEKEALVGLWLEGQRYFGGTVLGVQDGAAAPHKMVEPAAGEAPVLAAAAHWLDAYFAGRRPSVKELALRPAGSEFQRAVWALLCEIPYGEVVTYGELAAEMAKQRAMRQGEGTGGGNGANGVPARAVGGAVGHNPISIIIPCHRVVGAGGRLTGYAGGLARKKQLLALEGVDLAALR